MVKFRSMTDERDADGELLPDPELLLPLGQFLRSTSLDELPEVYNVIKGYMSLAGPRPLLMRYLDRYTPEQARRNLAKPGITRLAQVSGRNELSWERKFDLDGGYVADVSLRTDLAILFRTVTSVVRRSGIQSAGHATAHEFLGSEGSYPSS